MLHRPFTEGRMLTDIVEAVDDRSARGIAAAIGRMVTSGALPTDSSLPTVRTLSRGLGVSPTTISEASQTLAAVGAIEARGRLRSEEHTSELQSRLHLVCRLLL